MEGKTIYVYSSVIQYATNEPKEAVVTGYGRKGMIAQKQSHRPSEQDIYYSLPENEGEIHKSTFWLFKPDADKALKISKDFQRQRLERIEAEYAEEKKRIIDFLGEK